MELRRFFNSVGRMIWLVILLGAIGGGYIYYTSYYMATPIYEAETTVYAMSKGSTIDKDVSINYQDVLLSRQLVEDYKEIITSEKVMTLAVKMLDKYQFSQEQLISMITVTQKNESSVIAITATADEAKIAADISNAVTQAFISQLREMTNGNIVGVLDEAKIPVVPIPNDNKKTIAIGTLAGMFIALAIIYIRELFDTTVRSVEDIEYNLKINVIGIIPKYAIK